MTNLSDVQGFKTRKIAEVTRKVIAGWPISGVIGVSLPNHPLRQRSGNVWVIIAYQNDGNKSSFLREDGHVR